MTLLKSYRSGAVHYLSIDIAASGDNTILAAVSGKRLAVMSYVLVGAGTVTARWKSGSSNNLSGAMSLVAGSNVPMPEGLNPNLVTLAGEALVINLGGAVQVSGHTVVVELEEI